MYTSKSANIKPKRINTLIIFDWDDTLYPTSWMFNVDKINEKDQLIDKLISNVLRTYKQFGTLIIVTNASKGWVEKCIETLPFSRKAIEDVEIISAKHENVAFSNDIREWKKMTFNRIIFGRKYNYNNILSIGDAEYEYIALLDVHKKKSNSLFKSLKLNDMPNFSTYKKQLYLLKKNAQKICAIKNNLDLVLYNA